MPTYQLKHRTTYHYSIPVAVSRHMGYLKPAANQTQGVDEYELVIVPAPTERIERTDYFGNTQVQFQIEESHEVLTVTAKSKVRVAPRPRGPLQSRRTCQDVRQILGADTSKPVLSACLMASPSHYTHPGKEVEAFASDYLRPGTGFLQAAVALNEAIHERFEFDPTVTDVGTRADEVFQHQRGVCQDFAHLMLACFRSQRLPARYVSGYILTHPPEGERRLEGADASHAWVSVWVPDLGWVDLDPTNNMLCGEEHITVACGRDYADVNPLRGAVTGGGSQQVEIGVTMTPLEEGS